MTDNPVTSNGRPEPSGDEPRLPPAPWTQDLRLLLAIAGPNVASTAAQTLMSFVDYAIVSRLPDASAAQAAVSSGGMVFLCVFAFPLGLMSCVTTVVSQSYGAGRDRDCSAYAWQGLWLSLLFGAAALVLWPMTPGCFRLIGHAPQVQCLEVTYTQIRWLSLGAAGAAMGLGSFFNGIHRPMVNATSVAVTTAINAVLTYAMVFGAWGLPAMGVAGAAWATVIATILRTVWLLAAMCGGEIGGRFGARHTWRFDADKTWRLLKVGWPAGVQFALDIAAWSLLLVAIVGRFGTVHLAAMATVWRYTELAFMPAVGVGGAVCTVIGSAIGQGRPDLARRRAWLGAAINVAYMGFMAVVFIGWRFELMRLFSRDAPVIELGAELFILAAVFQVFDAVGITYSNALRGAGDTAWPAVVSAVQGWLLMIAGGAWMVWWYPQLGSRGPWLLATIYIIVLGITLAWRWYGGKWETLDVIGRRPPAMASSNARV